MSRRGVASALPLWSAHALLSEAGLAALCAIHADYARAGAEILVTSTFRTTRRALAKSGRSNEWRGLNRRAVDCARAGALAASGTCLVAGGLAPLEDCYRPDLAPAEELCREEHRRQVELLVSLGVDLIFIETMNCVREARAALAAARECGRPILLSLCPRAPAALLSGEPFTSALPELLDAGGASLSGVLLNCATPEVLAALYPAFAALVHELPHGVYAHLGAPLADGGWQLPAPHEPERYADWIAARVEEGARLVGGCCGTTPAHIDALRRRLECGLP